MSIVIVGGGHAGGQAAATLRQNGYSGKLDLICAEPTVPYQRPPLSKEYLRGEFEEDRVLLRAATFYERQSIDVHLNLSVAEVNPERKTVNCVNGLSLEYDALVLATGSIPRRLELPGSELAGVHYLRSLQDAAAIRSNLAKASSAVIVGGGYIGLEVASVCVASGLLVTVVEVQDRILQRVTTPTMSQFYEQMHAKHGVTIRCGLAIDRLESESGSQKVSKAVCSDGTSIPADLVIIGVGVTPATQLAESAGLECNNGIIVDESCRTTAKDIWAIGDCTNHPNHLYGARLRLESVPNAMEQARIVGKMLSDTPATYEAVPWFWSDQYDVKLQMVGLSSFGDREAIRGDLGSGSFCVFHFHGQTLVAADAVNARKEFLAARQLVGRTVSPEFIADPNSDLRTLL